jgi:hypothetical protein
MQLPKLEPMPIEALTKIQIFLDDTTLANIIGMVHVCFNDEGGYIRNSAHNAVFDTYRVLLEVRRELLKVVGKKVHDKNYRMDMRHIAKRLEKIFDRLNKEIDEVTQEENKEKSTIK